MKAANILATIGMKGCIARAMELLESTPGGWMPRISSGAALVAIAQKLPELRTGARVLGFNYDTGKRYLSIEEFLPA